MKRMCLVQDDSSHWYVIPAEKRADWEAWLDSEDAEDGILPEWADGLNRHPSFYSFTDIQVVTP